MSASANELERFVQAQAPIFDAVCAELRAGIKRTHWMWFVFPQLRGLGSTSTAQFYGIGSAAEAIAYWRHPVLGRRLKTCVDLVLAAPGGKSAHAIFGSPDDLKFRSCLTLFQTVAPEEACFRTALGRFYGGQPDQLTIQLLTSSEPPQD